jgi:hypothetical protein
LPPIIIQILVEATDTLTSGISVTSIHNFHPRPLYSSPILETRKRAADRRQLLATMDPALREYLDRMELNNNNRADSILATQHNLS